MNQLTADKVKEIARNVLTDKEFLIVTYRLEDALTFNRTNSLLKKQNYRRCEDRFLKRTFYRAKEVLSNYIRKYVDDGFLWPQVAGDLDGGDYELGEDPCDNGFHILSVYIKPKKELLSYCQEKIIPVWNRGDKSITIQAIREQMYYMVSDLALPQKVEDICYENGILSVQDVFLQGRKNLRRIFPTHEKYLYLNSILEKLEQCALYVPQHSTFSCLKKGEDINIGEMMRRASHMDFISYQEFEEIPISLLDIPPKIFSTLVKTGAKRVKDLWELGQDNLQDLFELHGLGSRHVRLVRKSLGCKGDNFPGYYCMHKPL